uniref:Tryptophan 5-hydroxylase 1 n=1 Tax=Cacopsylla melanoneura TaxID=428564 RepID=A0A8D8Z511_9HEMI
MSNFYTWLGFEKRGRAMDFDSVSPELLPARSKSILFTFHREFAGSIQRPFGVRYNPYTLSVEILSNSEKIAALVSELRGDLCIVRNALKKIHAREETVENLTHMLTDTMHIDKEEPSDEDRTPSPGNQGGVGSVTPTRVDQ